MFRIKICGVTTVSDAEAVASSGADAIGLNFYPGSPRRISVDRAREIRDVLPAAVGVVGLFVNAEISEVNAIHDRVGFDYVQFHGDETPEKIATWTRCPIIRAFRGVADAATLLGYLDSTERCGARVAGVLIDGVQAGEYGGTGVKADWNQVADLRSKLSVPLVLAGGLTPNNVAGAISAAVPDAVDTASGVELELGRKDPLAVREFVINARTAFRSEPSV